MLSKSENKITFEQIQTLELLQRKMTLGYRDVEAGIKKRIVQNHPVSIIILIVKTGIIDSDIKHQLTTSLAFLKIEFVRISLVSEQEIVAALKNYDNKFDIVAISRGGGENLEVFNKLSIAHAALSLSSYFITAIGHKEDVTLFQKLADKQFITPTALGQYLNDIYKSTVDDMQNSKVHLVDTVKQQLQADFDKQKKANQSFYLLLIVIAIILGILIGKGCN